MKYEELFRHYYTMVYRLSLLLLKNRQDAEDAAMTIFLRVMETKPDFADDDHTRAWLITVTRNYCTDVKRSSWNRKRTDLEELPEQTVEPFVEQFGKQESLLFEIFQSLPKKQREVVYLYYFEDYSVKEIGQLLERNESTVQSQLFAARKRMKMQFNASKAAVLVLCLAFFVCFGTVVADAASGGRVVASIREFFSIGLNEEKQKVAKETLTLPVEVYASELVAVDGKFLVLANERGLLIYDRTYETMVSALDLQQIDCNYFHAKTLITRIFLDDGKLYLFNEHVESTDNEYFYNEKNVTTAMPDFAYVYDISALYRSEYMNYNQELTSDGLIRFTYEDPLMLTKVTEKKALEEIFALWKRHEDDFKDTFEEFQGADFLDEDNEKYDQLSYSRKAFLWTDESGKKMLSCLVANKDSIYQLYTKLPDGSFVSEPLNLVVVVDHASSDSVLENTGRTDQSDGERRTPQTPEQKEPETLPEFVYSGDDPVMETLCAYLKEVEENEKFGSLSEDNVYIPAPLIFDTVEEGDDLVVFCNLWSYVFYRNGNMLVCESGGEAPARLRLVKNEKKPGGYDVVEDIRGGEGSEYETEIKKFCKGYPGMEKKYFSEKYDHNDAQKDMVSMYVRDNNLSVKFLKHSGWDPVPLDLDE